MIYLVDSGVFITAKNLYYQMNRVPEFWDWLEFQSEAGKIKVPTEIYEEIVSGKDDLAEWARGRKENLIIDEDVSDINTVINQGYGFTNGEIDEATLEQMGKDPFIILYGLHDPANRIIISSEVSSPKRMKKNKKIPDICFGLGIQHYDVYHLIRALDFRTNWKTYCIS